MQYIVLKDLQVVHKSHHVAQTGQHHWSVSDSLRAGSGVGVSHLSAAIWLFTLVREQVYEPHGGGELRNSIRHAGSSCNFTTSMCLLLMPTAQTKPACRPCMWGFTALTNRLGTHCYSPWMRCRLGTGYCPAFCQVAPTIHLLPIYTPGWKEAL